MQHVRRIVTGLVAAGVGLTSMGLAAPAQAAAPSAPASSHGSRSLAAVLTSDGNQFDHNWHDYDIVTEAALAVLKAKPNSPVKVITDGKTPITVFAPNDRAFRRLATDLFHKHYRSEKAVFTDLATKVGVDTIENVLLYHVVPGKTITAKQALGLPRNAAVATALPGASFRVHVRDRHPVTVELKDNDRNDTNPYLLRTQLDLNKGNKQIAHGINRVLRPVDL
ncbi:MAG: fasciclin domain-containing protein [Kineosporiaceae bacterium]|nr:fasciclin domain-containing protein [Kineosporiaceae bacterium]